MVGRDELQSFVQKVLPNDRRFSLPANISRALSHDGFVRVMVKTSTKRITFLTREYLLVKEISCEGRFVQKSLGSDGWRRFQMEVNHAFHKRFPETIELDYCAHLAIGSATYTG